MSIVKRLVLSILWFIPLFTAVQGYIITDKDGYTNMREKPTVNSQIIDRLLQYEVFFLATDFCGNDALDFSHVPDNWIAVTKSYDGEIGYVLKKNIQSLEQLPSIWSERFTEPHRLTASHDTLTVNLLLGFLEEGKHEITYEGEGEYTYIAAVDGKFPRCIGAGGSGDQLTGKHMEITGLEIVYKDKTVNLPLDEEVKTLYNPHNMIVSFDSEGGMYIQIFCGDGGEAYSICISVVNDEVVYVLNTTLC